jgi:hypothetical protein
MKNKHMILPLVILLLLVFIVGITGSITSCFSPFTNMGFKYDSNGERIYYTATSSSGQPINYSGSIRMMHTITCANCHGQDGKGGRVHMMMWNFNVPDIRWEHLTEEEHHEEQDIEEEHEEHPPYTEETLKLAITKGLNPAGEPLDKEMPRWYMTEPDLDDLVDFIKTLK